MSTIPDETDQVIELGKMPQQLEARGPREDWTGVTDPAERRKLQNRLNQRAYRTRVRTKDTRMSTRDKRHGSMRQDRNSSQSSSPSAADESVDLVAPRKGCINTNPRVQAVMKQFADHAYQRYLNGEPVLEHLPILMQYNVDSAMWRNAELLGVTKENADYEGISPIYARGLMWGTPEFPYPGSWPASLYPTELQRTMEHHPWLDLFPLPRMRDNFLRAFAHPDICDEDELCRDLCQYGDPDEKAMLIVWGSSWDPRSWEVSDRFLRKWGWLLCGCPEIFQSTNYWRSKRGEKRLTIQEVTDSIMESRPKILIDTDE